MSKKKQEKGQGIGSWLYQKALSPFVKSNGILPNEFHQPLVTPFGMKFSYLSGPGSNLAVKSDPKNIKKAMNDRYEVPESILHDSLYSKAKNIQDINNADDRMMNSLSKKIFSTDSLDPFKLINNTVAYAGIAVKKNIINKVAPNLVEYGGYDKMTPQQQQNVDQAIDVMTKAGYGKKKKKKGKGKKKAKK